MPRGSCFRKVEDDGDRGGPGQRVGRRVAPLVGGGVIARRRARSAVVTWPGPIQGEWLELDRSSLIARSEPDRVARESAVATTTVSTPSQSARAGRRRRMTRHTSVAAVRLDHRQAFRPPARRSPGSPGASEAAGRMSCGSGMPQGPGSRRVRQRGRRRSVGLETSEGRTLAGGLA